MCNPQTLVLSATSLNCNKIFGGTDWVSGIGVNYKIKDNTSIEFKHKRYDLKNGNNSNPINNTAIGIKFSF